MMRGLKPFLILTKNMAISLLTYMHVPDDEGIETDLYVGSDLDLYPHSYMHVPDDEGIETARSLSDRLACVRLLTCMSPMMRGLKPKRGVFCRCHPGRVLHACPR